MIATTLSYQTPLIRLLFDLCLYHKNKFCLTPYYDLKVTFEPQLSYIISKEINVASNMRHRKIIDF